MSVAALSTMWMQHRCDHVQPFASEARDLGFPAIELSHFVTPERMHGLVPGVIDVVSLHYPAPTVLDSRGRKADKLLASLDEGAREWAVAEGHHSIDTARELGASVVCLHLGQVEMDTHLCWALEQRYLAGQQGAEEYELLRARILQERGERQPDHLAAARQSLSELAEYAAKTGVCLGLENRRHPHEIPGIGEIRSLLSEYDPQSVGLWYDTGHAQVLGELGFDSPADWAALCSERGVGVHLHDSAGLRDHLVPGLGEVDFASLTASLPQDAVRVCEFDWYFDRSEVWRGRELLQVSGCLPPSFD